MLFFSNTQIVYRYGSEKRSGDATDISDALLGCYVLSRNSG